MQHQRLMVPMQASRVFVNSMKPFGSFPISRDIGKLALIRLLLLQLLPTMEEDNKAKQNIQAKVKKIWIWNCKRRAGDNPSKETGLLYLHPVVRSVWLWTELSEQPQVFLKFFFISPVSQSCFVLWELDRGMEGIDSELKAVCAQGDMWILILCPKKLWVQLRY